MGGKGTLKDLLKKIFQSKEINNGKRISKKTGYLITIALIGLFLLVIGNLFTGKKDDENMNQPEVSPKESVETSKNEKKEDETTSDISELEKSYEEDLTDMLENIDNVSNPEIMVNLDSTKVKVYEEDLITEQQTTDETDTQGGMRKLEDQSEETETVTIRQGDEETPILVKTKKPEVRGVFVVANGVEDIEVEKWVIESVSRVLDVPTHQVSVMPKN